MNDPRGILEEFVEVCAWARSFRKVADPVNGNGLIVDTEIALNLDPESRRQAYRDKQERRGQCRSCKEEAKPGRKYCTAHLAKANARALKSLRARREPPPP